MLPSTFTTNKGVSSVTEYDDLGRTTKRTAGDSKFVVSNLTYEDGTIDNSTTGLVKTFSATGQATETYTYDTTGLITQISSSAGNRQYNYDEKSQIEYAVDYRNHTITNYTYDDGGNITRKLRQYNFNSSSTTIDDITYTYDTFWDDLLISVGNETIEYDEIGNPTKYLEYDTLSWTGKNLDFIKIGNTAVGSYTYDSDGLRVSKTVSGVDTEYIYTDGQVSALNIDGDMLYFTYDGNGSLVSVTYDDEIYYYVLNPQGDVIGLCDESGTSVATYTYDEWGYPISAPTSGIGALNPFRYRGYIYDAETGFYYLGSRYYDPEVGRFINADDPAVLTSTPLSLTDKNLFAYCDNNPIMRKDADGAFWETAFDLISLGMSVADVVSNPTDPWAWAGLVGDAVDLIPFVTGVGEITRTVKLVNKVDDLSDTVKFANKADDFKDVLAKGACFVAGTLVNTSEGYVSIEDICVGDKVWSLNIKTGDKELKEVTQVFVNKIIELIYIFVNNEEIITTTEHPFFVYNKGWVEAIKLKEGDTLISHNGECVVIKKIQNVKLESPIPVYNFEVKDFHTYFVGKSSILVHNTCSRPKLQVEYSTRKQAFNAAKRDIGVPRSQQPIVKPNINKKGKVVPGRVYDFGNGKYIRDDIAGHVFSDGTKMRRHLNTSKGLHLFY